MDVCRCGKEKELATLEIQIVQIKENEKELRQGIKENKDSIKVIENLAVDIALYGQQLVTLTTEIKDIKTTVNQGTKYPADYYEMKQEYSRTKRIADNVEHYKKAAIVAIIIAFIGAFLVGLKVSL